MGGKDSIKRRRTRRHPSPIKIYMNAVQRYTEEVQIVATCSVTQCDTVTESLHFERFRDVIVVTDVLCLEVVEEK